MGKYWSHSQETRDRIAAALQGLRRSEETKERMRQAHIGKTPTDEARERMRRSQREAQNRPGVAAKKGGPNTGRSAGRPRVRYPDPNTLIGQGTSGNGPRPADNDPRPGGLR